MSYAVDAAVDAVQPTRSDASRNRALIETHATQLLHRDDAMLPSSDLRDLPIYWGAFLSHTESKPPAPPTLPPPRPLSSLDAA
jgi:hypothetical protein